jgi:hypothetical protein
MKKSLLAGVAVLAGTCYAMAADFYVVQDTATKQCRVAEQRPTGPAMVIVGAERSYSSQAEADAALKASSICNQSAQAPTGNQTAQAPTLLRPGHRNRGVGGDTKIMTDVPPNSMPVTNSTSRTSTTRATTRSAMLTTCCSAPTARSTRW